MVSTKIIRCDANHEDFKELVRLLDKDLAITDGDDHAFYDQFNKIDDIKYVLLFYNQNRAIGCGAIKPFKNDTRQNAIEVKRMYTRVEARGKGVASGLLKELEKWAAELGYEKCRLETGKRQPDAIGLYLKNGYEIIDNYGQYAGVENSVCFEKKLE